MLTVMLLEHLPEHGSCEKWCSISDRLRSEDNERGARHRNDSDLTACDRHAPSRAMLVLNFRAADMHC